MKSTVAQVRYASVTKTAAHHRTLQQMRYTIILPLHYHYTVIRHYTIHRFYRIKAIQTTKQAKVCPRLFNKTYFYLPFYRSFSSLHSISGTFFFIVYMYVAYDSDLSEEFLDCFRCSTDPQKLRMYSIVLLANVLQSSATISQCTRTLVLLVIYVLQCYQ